MTEFRNYQNENYQAVCNFLIELNKTEKLNINWNWARFEWMYEHPEFDKSLLNSIGLWWDGGKIVGAAIYDMYFGEAFCGVLPSYKDLFGQVLDYAFAELKDEGGIRIAICDDCDWAKTVAKEKGFSLADQTENIMSKKLDMELSADLPGSECLHFENLNPGEQAYDFQWLLWQGFDHGNDKEEFEKSEKIVPQVRPNLNPELSVTAVNKKGEKVSYCCLWYNETTDYCYVEPVCTIPAYRGKGVSRAVVYETLNRARKLGATKAYVISDMEFYKKLGFEQEKNFTFWWK